MAALSEAEQADRRQELLALGAALVTVVLWASAFVGIRAAGEDLTGGALSLGRLLVASVVLGVIVLVRSEKLPARRDLGLVLVCGVLWFGIYNVALNEAERRVDAGTAAMLVNVGPILIALLAGWLLEGGLPAHAAAGHGGGVRRRRGHRPGHLPGRPHGQHRHLPVPAGRRDLRGRGGGPEAAAVALVGAGRDLGRLHGGRGGLPAVRGPRWSSEVGEADAGSIAWTVYLGVFPTAIAFTTWAYALTRSTAGRMGSTTYLVPPLAILMGWAILGETPPALALLGGVLCLTGAAMARRTPPPDAA